MNIMISRKKVILGMSLVLIGLVILSVAGQIYKFVLHNGMDRYLTSMFNLDEEHNVPTFYVTLILLLCSLLLLVIGTSKRGQRNGFGRHWRFLGAVFFLFAVDEMLILHEQTITPLKRFFHARGVFFFAWTIPAILLLAVFLLLFRKFLLHLPPKQRMLFILSGMVYVAGALGMEMYEGTIVSAQGTASLRYALMTNLEETIEMAGLIMFANALLFYIKDHVQDLRLKVI